MATTLSVALSTLVFGLATLTQELLIASAFGTSYRLDAFQLAFLPLSVLANVVQAVVYSVASDWHSVEM